jgi:hypothetical protein
MNVRCFVDVDGYVWSIDHNGKSNFPHEIELRGDTVLVLGDFDGGARLIEEEYTLHPSLTALSMCIEQTYLPSCDGSVSLDQAVAEVHLQAEAFKADWLKLHEKSPAEYPMSIGADNAGIWFEQIMEFSNI